MHGPDSIPGPHTDAAVHCDLSPDHRRDIAEAPGRHDFVSFLAHTLDGP
jgi:hypothetical protein